MKRVTLYCCTLLLSSLLFAQDVTQDFVKPDLGDLPKDTVAWKHSLQAGLNINQASFSSNWKAGGTNSLAMGGIFNDKIIYTGKKIEFTSDVQLAYASVQNQGQEVRKTNDRIFSDQKIGYRIVPKWYAFGSLNFQSQFDAGFEYAKDSTGFERGSMISKFMAPAFFTQSIGVEYKPAPWISARAGLGTLRQTFVTDTTIYRNVAPNYGVEIGKRTRFEVAMLFVLDVDKEVAKNLFLKSRFSAFYNYETLNTMDYRWDLVLTAKVNKLVNVNLSTTIMYDKDMDASVQYAQALGLGILFSKSN
jgi:hypothetical protein